MKSVCIAVLSILVSVVQSKQFPMQLDSTAQPQATWTVTLSDDWDALGPFPISAREQHYVSLAFPLDFSNGFQHDPNLTVPSSYADNGKVTWVKRKADANGHLAVSFPDIRWEELRRTEGWSVLQHHSVLRTQITLYPPSLSEGSNSHNIRLLVNLRQGSFFTLLPTDGAIVVPRWYAGNIYDIPPTAWQAVELPSVPLSDKPTVYDLFVSGDYEIRLFGDPHGSNSETPTLQIDLNVELEMKSPALVRDASQDVVCDFVGGIAFGNALGIGMKAVEGWWNIEEVKLLDLPEESISTRLLRPVRLAPSQTSIIPVHISQVSQYQGDSLKLALIATSTTSDSRLIRTSLTVELKLRQRSLWTSETFETLTATYFFARSQPTAFLATPPVHPNVGEPRPIVVALHGAGVDILSMPFWEQAIPRQSYSWTVLPTGRTAWGLDWHGPSTNDIWESVTALYKTLQKQPTFSSWGIAENTKMAVIGHSNGGQGAWYFGSRFPDRVVGVIAAAGYMKSQLYVPLNHMRSGHFVDPSLRAVLESSLTPDDNDLFLTNLANKPVLAIHGAVDENVPTWHSREAFSVVKSWNPDANISFREDLGKLHWYSEIFHTDDVQTFLDKVLLVNSSLDSALPNWSSERLVLTVAHPEESGTLHGFKILQLGVPGRLARLSVWKQPQNRLGVRTQNVRAFCYDPTVLNDVLELMVDDQPLEISKYASDAVVVVSNDSGEWIPRSQELLNLENATDEVPNAQNLYGADAVIGSSSIAPNRLLRFLSPLGPIKIVVPSPVELFSHHLSIALRYAWNLDVYHKLGVDIITDEEALALYVNGDGRKDDFDLGNVLVIGGYENLFARHVMMESRSEFKMQTDGSWVLDRERLRPNSGLVFTHPHVNSRAREAGAFILFIVSTPQQAIQKTQSEPKSTSFKLDNTGLTALERTFRLLPLRTGVPAPDWLIVGEDADRVGMAGLLGAGVWTHDWRWNAAMSWFR